MPKIHLTVKDLLTKEFKTKRHGYDPTDVDSFLDIIMRDYTTFNKYMKDHSQNNDTLSTLKSRNSQLQSTIQRKNRTIQALQNRVNALQQDSTHARKASKIINQTPSNAKGSNQGDHTGSKAVSQHSNRSAKYSPRVLNILHRLDRLEEAVYHK